MKLVVEIYRITKCYPKEETFGLVSQMRRAAVSVPSNIAEGAARKHTNEYMQFLYVSQGSLSELETQCLISLSLQYLKDENSKIIMEMIRITRAQLSRLIAVLYNKRT